MSLINIDLNKNVNVDLINYVKDNLPSNLKGDLEVALSIYMLLCNVLKYDPDYVIYGEFDRTNDFSEVTRENNKIVCYHFAVIYKKILELYGIESKLSEGCNHMEVSIRIDNMIVYADPTRSGFFADKYKMGDLSNLKFGLLLNGVSCWPANNNYDIRECEEIKSKFARSIRNVYRKMGIKIGNTNVLELMINRIKKREDDIYDATSDDFDRIIDLCNSFKPLDSKEFQVENIQFIYKVVGSILRDIWDDRAECMTLYNETSGEVVITKLLVLYDCKGKPCYYLYQDGKFSRKTVDEIYNFMVSGNWYFKYPNDIDALALTDMVMINKLYKH